MMNHQQMYGGLKSQTLPKLEGQDEDSEVTDVNFEVSSIASSCPDLSILVPERVPLAICNSRFPSNERGHGLHVAPIPVNYPEKKPLSVRRSTSLNSLGAEGGNSKNADEETNTVDGNTLSVIPAVGGSIAKTIGKLEKTLGRENLQQVNPTDFIRCNLRASHNGTLGYLHKSISSPSVTQYFSGLPSKVDQRQIPPDLPHQSSKRSFFRRKNKSKHSTANSHPPVVVQHYRHGPKMGSNEKHMLESVHIGTKALNDASLGLQESDAECWALSMPHDVVSSLEDKEVKRQEHIYELILTEKHHCLTLALMDHLFIRDMRKHGFARQAKQMFPDLKELLQVHFAFFRRLRERQLRFREIGQPVDTIVDILTDHFSGELWHKTIRLYGLLCASHSKALEMFKHMMKDQKFATLVSQWDKQSLLSRKNVRECLLLVAQRITKYPLLFEPLLKTSMAVSEKEQLQRVLSCSKELISKVNERVAERERLIELCQKIDPKSYLIMNEKRRSKDELIALPSRRLLFTGHATVLNSNKAALGNSNAAVSGAGLAYPKFPCIVLILTDSLVFIQDLNGRLHFLSPPGVVMLSNLIVRENARQNSSLFLVLSSGTNAEMIELQVTNPANRDIWMNKIRDARARLEEEAETLSDDEEYIAAECELGETSSRILMELQDRDRQIMNLLSMRSKLVDTMREERPNMWMMNHFEGKNSVMSSISTACHEVQKMIHNLDSSGNTVGINRSASTAGEHMASGMLNGLPKRADTFGGFDSQQRLLGENSQVCDNRLLLQMLVHLQSLCGEMFKQMVMQFSPAHHQLNRRMELMEELREAQQRLENEKATFQLEMNEHKKKIMKERDELNQKKEAVLKDEKDVKEQRDQLYRKLEALQRQGISPSLQAPASASPVATNSDKPPTSSVPVRRPMTHSQSQNSLSQHSQNANIAKGKQQLPLHLAASSSTKNASSSPDIAPKPTPRSSFSSKNKSVSNSPVSSDQLQPNDSPTKNNNHHHHRTSNGNNGVATTNRGALRSSSHSQSVSQLIPLRLSEGSSQTSSLPRGVGIGPRSQSSDRQPLLANQNNGSRNHGFHQNHQYISSTDSSGSPSRNSYDRNHRTAPVMNSNSFREMSCGDSPRSVMTNGYADYSAPAVAHRRSGSSPVPMSSTTPLAPNSSVIPPHSAYMDSTDDDQETKILYL